MKEAAFHPAPEFTGIDSHQHFWKYHPESHGWINDGMQVIRKDFFPADLKPLLDEQGISGSVAVQADQTIAETDFLIDLSQQHPFIKGVVGWTDLRAADIEQQLEKYQQLTIVKGFRHILQGEEPSFMLQPEFIRGIAALKKYGFTYDILIYPQHLPAAIELVKQFPDQLFVIDHIAKPFIKYGLLGEWEKGMQAMASFPNLYCKISGMVTEANWKNWQYSDFVPYLDVVTTAFGVNRIMYGSDWPVCLVAADYASMIGITRKYYSSFSTTEQAAIFGKNAIQFYQL